MLDSYEALIPNYISKENFFTFGLEKSIYIPQDKATTEWKKLKEKINANKPVYIRGLKESSSNHMFFDFYKKVFKNEQVVKDPSNTQNPAKIIEELTGLKKSKDLKNYQLSSIFGRSRNIFAFTAPWNLVYIPSMLDPLLNADAKGDLALEFQKAFMRHGYEKFKPMIEEYNSIVTNRHLLQTIDDFFGRIYENNLYDRPVLASFEDSIREELLPIKVS